MAAHRSSLTGFLSACLLLLSHLPAAHIECTTGTYQQCQEADYIPSHDLAGAGFDITTLRRTAGRITPTDGGPRGAHTCTLCPNWLLNGQAEKLPWGVAEWRSYPTCALKVSNNLFTSAAAYAEALGTGIASDWQAGLGDMPEPVPDEVAVVAGSRARLAQFAMKLERQGGYSFVSREVTCIYYRYQMSECPHPETYFSDWLKLLPPAYSSSTKPLFYSLIGKYGTHYIRKVELGGHVREVTALKTCDLARDGLSGEDVKDCLGVEAFATISPDLAEKANRCWELRAQKLSNQMFSEKYSEREVESVGGSPEAAPTFRVSEQGQTYQKWAGSLHRVPDIVSYTLAPLYELVSFVGPTKDNLKRAITDYIKERAVRLRCPACPERALPRPPGVCNCQCTPSPDLTEECCARQEGLAGISVFVTQGTSLNGDTVTETDGYVLVSFGTEQRKTTIIDNNDNPRWDQSLEFGFLPLSLGKPLTVEVWDDDGLFGNDLLGSCDMEAMSTLGSIPHICALNKGSVTFNVTIKCLPNLHGNYCEIYQPGAQ